MLGKRRWHVTYDRLESFLRCYGLMIISYIHLYDRKVSPKFQLLYLSSHRATRLSFAGFDLLHRLIQLDREQVDSSI